MTTETAQHDAVAGLRMALWSVLLLGLVAAIIAALAAGVHSALSVAVGAGIAALNLWAISVVLRGVLGQLSRNVPWGLLGALKFIMLFAGVYALVKSGVVQLLPLVIGYAALPLGIVAAQLSPAQSPASPGSDRGESTSRN